MNMYRGTRKFDREQLVFMVDVILDSAMDRIATALPDELDFETCNMNMKSVDAWIISATETAGTGMAVLYAQLTGEGIGIGDCLSFSRFETFVQYFKEKRLDPNWTGLNNGDPFIPDCRKLAENFVDEMFKEYMDETL